MQRSRIVRSAVTATALTLAAAGGAYALNRGGTTPPAAPAHVALAAYRSFSSCDDLLGYLRAQALPLVGPYGLSGIGGAGPIGLRGAAPGIEPRAAGIAAGSPAGSGAAGSASASGPATSSSADVAGTTSATGTNVQVAGVDEADVTKKSGDLVLTVGSGADGGLTVLRGSGRRLRVVGRLTTDWRPEQLLVRGTTVLLLGTVPEDRRPGPIPAPPADGAPIPLRPVPTDQPHARIAQVDVADPAHPRLVRTLDTDGELVGARLAGGVVSLAVAATPSRLPFVQPQSYPTGNDQTGAAAIRSAVAANERVVRTAPITDWLPRWTLTPPGGNGSSGSLLDCTQVGVPAEFSGLGTLAMLTFDLGSGGVDRWNGAGVVASGTTLYSTGDHTYVATRALPGVVQRPPAGPGQAAPDIATIARSQRTLVHAFETTASGVRYLGSGSVDGGLLGQYAMDEYQGMLRVASTVQPDVMPRVEMVPRAAQVPGAEGTAGAGSAEPSTGSSTRPSTGPGTSAQPQPPTVRRVSPPIVVAPIPRPTVVPPLPETLSAGSVTVLKLQDGRLQQVGRVDGLGRNEVVRAVRFAGPLAYVVTFRQTDPLFVVDLADPSHPRVAGSVGLLGYSAYLHPLGNGLLLGVGQDATTTGNPTGLLMSLFDVSDPAAPRLLDRVTLPGAWAQVESDAHAFTYDGGLALVPLQQQGSAVGSADGSGPAATLQPDDAAVVAVRVEGRRLGTPAVLQLHAGPAAAGLDTQNLRTFVGGSAIWSVAPGYPQGVAAVHDAGSLRWLTSTTF